MAVLAADEFLLCMLSGSTTFDRRHLTTGPVAAVQLTVQHLTIPILVHFTADN